MRASTMDTTKDTTCAPHRSMNRHIRLEKTVFLLSYIAYPIPHLFAVAAHFPVEPVRMRHGTLEKIIKPV